MNARTAGLWWTERALLAAALVCAVWTLIAAAQAHFYASLPVPSGPGMSLLPGDSGDTARVQRVEGGRHQSVQAGEWVARLEAPSAGLTATVLEGSTDDMLARAAGHIEDTAFPGQAGNVGIAGHRDTTFRAVRKLAVGDPLVLTTADGRFEYRITRTFIVNPDAVSVLDPTAIPSLTLVTCYPFTFIGHAPKRYIVQAELQGQPHS